MGTSFSSLSTWQPRASFGRSSWWSKDRFLTSTTQRKVIGQKTGEPILTCDWIDRLAPNAWAVVAAGTCATYGGIHAMAGNPTGCMGLADYLGWQWKSTADIPIRWVP